MMNEIDKFSYFWPNFKIKNSKQWKLSENKKFHIRELPENPADLAIDSQWPAFFPSAMCLVTTSDGSLTALEKVVGSTVVNRFPFVVALSFCTKELSDRHYARKKFTQILEKGEEISIQFIAPGKSLNKVMYVIEETEDGQTEERIKLSGLSTQKAISNSTPVFSDAYLVYEGKLVRRSKDLEGEIIFPESYFDMGSHRIYFIEIDAIQLRKDITEKHNQIAWKSLPSWQPKMRFDLMTDKIIHKDKVGIIKKYIKPFTPFYRFPVEQTADFLPDYDKNGMSVKHIKSKIEFDNDLSRYPCFYPSSIGMITSRTEDGIPNVIPCGSTTVISRNPLVIGVAIGYADINDRYSPRASLDIIRKSKKFGCGVPFINDMVLNAIAYSGNVSLKDDKQKLIHSGLQIDQDSHVPILQDLPINFECNVIKEIKLGTHVLFLGEVRKIYSRVDLDKDNSIKWFPWADIVAQGR